MIVSNVGFSSVKLFSLEQIVLAILSLSYGDLNPREKLELLSLFIILVAKE